MSLRPIVRSASTRPAPARALVLVVAALLPSLAIADVEWHADLETARAASRISHRPVLAVFVASWSADAQAVETTCLGSPEAEAVLATCFEPVRIDIDAHAELTTATGITHVPTACILAADGTTLETFEMPGSPAAFVKTAILAAGRVADRDHATPATSDSDPRTVAGEGGEPESAAVTAAAFGSAVDATAGTGRPPRGALSRVTAKVRDLSAFASDHGAPAMTAAPVAIAQASRTIEQPRADFDPISWPSEPATALPTAPAPAPAIAPAGATLTPTTVSPWLDAPPVRAAPSVPPPPGSTAATPLPPPASTETPPAPPAGGLISTLQKPFSLFGRQAADPPTLPPALPRGPLAAAVTATTPPESGADPTAERYGSMPLGLEGYCPVTLVDHGAWKEGRAQWGARHRGRTYLFAGAAEQQAFLANPDRYAPALSGDDPVLALDRGSATPGQRRYGVTYQSRMYLFATPESRQAFAADPARYAGRIALAEQPAAAAGGTRLY